MLDMTEEERAALFAIILSEYDPAWPHYWGVANDSEAKSKGRKNDNQNS